MEKRTGQKQTMDKQPGEWEGDFDAKVTVQTRANVTEYYYKSGQWEASSLLSPSEIHRRADMTHNEAVRSQSASHHHQSVTTCGSSHRDSDFYQAGSPSIEALPVSDDPVSQVARETANRGDNGMRGDEEFICIRLHGMREDERLLLQPLYLMRNRNTGEHAASDPNTDDAFIGLPPLNFGGPLFSDSQDFLSTEMDKSRNSPHHSH